MQTLARDVREMVGELIEYRELLVQMTRRDLLLRYKQTAMGFAWAIFMPLVNTVVFSVLFTRVAPIDTKVPYPVFAYCGLLSWNFLASSLKFAATSLTSSAGLVTKVYFPREIFPLSAVFVCFVDFMVGSFVLVGLMLFYGVDVAATIVLLPMVVAVQIAFTCGMALLLAMANLFYRDVKYLFEIVLTVWMFLTSVLYPVELTGGRLAALLRLNPMTAIIDAYRSVLLYGELPPFEPFAGAALVSVVLLMAGWIAFHRAEFQFAENV